MENQNNIHNCKVSVLVPIYDEEGNIEELTNRIIGVLRDYKEYEIVFVDDGSQDESLTVIKKLRESNPCIHYLSFSRNFGHQNAIKAGIDNASGDCVISMDGDLQHPPEIIPAMIEKWQEGYDIVNTERRDDKDIGIIKQMTSKLFYRSMNKISNINLKQGTADFRLIDGKISDILSRMNENPLFFRGLVKWLGFKHTSIEYLAGKREYGSTKYSMSRMLNFAIEGITGFSIRPLRLSTYIGFLIAIAAILYGCYAIFIKLFTDRPVQGWTSVLVAITFIGGIQLIMIGILGEYLGKLFIESKRRPLYLIRESSFNQ